MSDVAPSMEPGHSTGPGETLLVRAPNWLGDVVMALPALRALRRAWPAARLVVIARRSVAGLYRWVPEVDEAVPCDRPPGWRGVPRLLAVARGLRRRRAGVYLSLPNSFEAALLGRLAGVPRRVGFARDGRSFLLSEGVPVPPELSRRHQVHYYLELVRRSGLARGGDGPAGADLALVPPPGVTAAADRTWSELQTGGAPVVGMHCGAHFGPAKRWPAERFAGLIRALRATAPVRVVLFGAAGERALADEVAEGAGPGGVDNLCGRTALEDLPALVRRCRLFVANDSGPMHVAAACGVPLVALFGSTDPVATGPLSPAAVTVKKPVDCSPCFRRECPFGLECFQAITVEEVARVALRLLASSESGPPSA